MIKFKKLEISDFEQVDKLLKKFNVENCDHCFSTLLIWSHRYPVEVAIEKNELFMRTKGENSYWYLSPVGEMDFHDAIDRIIEDAKYNDHNIKIFALDSRHKNLLEEKFPHTFEFIADEGSYDYIYKCDDLRLLLGKNYQKKRNHCSRFERDNPGYTFTKITSDNVELVKEFEKKWCQINNCDEARGLFSEQQGIMEILNNFQMLDVFGAYIETPEHGIVAFTLAAPINDSMVDIIVEKALHDITGAYAIINREFAVNCLENYSYINREDDMGEENLRKAKLSYFPTEIREKFLAKLVI